jgi:hypothetical protein
MIFMLAACAGVQSVKPYELGKVTAETILYQARVAHNDGILSDDQFYKVRDAYDKFRDAQNVAIDARKSLIAYNTAENQNKANIAMNEVLKLSTEFLALAQSLGLMEGGK